MKRLSNSNPQSTERSREATSRNSLIDNESENFFNLDSKRLIGTPKMPQKKK